MPLDAAHHFDQGIFESTHGLVIWPTGWADVFDSPLPILVSLEWELADDVLSVAVEVVPVSIDSLFFK